jgi:hypothetical protein
VNGEWVLAVLERGAGIIRHPSPGTRPDLGVDNDLGMPLAVPAGGGGQDGLTQWGPNENQGGESTLMWLTALEQMRDLRRLTQSDVRAEVLAESSFDGPNQGD